MPVPVTVVRDGVVQISGHRDDHAIVYDWTFPWAGTTREQRTYVLLDTGFQINATAGPTSRRGPSPPPQSSPA